MREAFGDAPAEGLTAASPQAKGGLSAEGAAAAARSLALPLSGPGGPAQEGLQLPWAVLATSASDLLAEDERLQGQHVEDAKVLAVLRGAALRLHAQNSELRDIARRALEESDALRGQNLRLAGALRADPPPEEALAASPPAEAVPPGNGTGVAAGNASEEAYSVHYFATQLSRAEAGDVPVAWVHAVIGALAVAASLMFNFARFVGFLAWSRLAQSIGVALFVADIGVAWRLACVHGARSLFLATLLISAPAVAGLTHLWRTVEFYDGTDLDGDGNVDWQDRMQAFQRTGQVVSLLYHTASNLMPVLALMAGGVALLWYSGMLQSYVAQVSVFLFFASFLLAFLGLFIYRIWKSLNTSIHKFFEQFKRFEHHVSDTLHNLPEKLQEAVKRGFGREDFPEFEDNLANVYADPFLTRPQRGNGTDLTIDPFLIKHYEERKREKKVLCDFAEALLDKFRTIEDAFDTFDEQKNRLVSLAEFRSAVRKVPQFRGDAMLVWRTLLGRRAHDRGAALKLEDFFRLQEAQEERERARQALEGAAAELQRALGLGPEAADAFPAEDAGAGTCALGGWALGLSGAHCDRRSLADALRSSLGRAKLLPVPERAVRAAELALKQEEVTSQLEDMLLAVASEPPGDPVAARRKLKELCGRAREVDVSAKLLKRADNLIKELL